MAAGGLPEWITMVVSIHSLREHSTTATMTLLHFSVIIGLMQYYIIQVATGREQFFVENVKKFAPQLFQKHNFIYLTRELTIRRQGKTMRELQPMFPSYIIVQTTSEVDSFTLAALKKVPDFYHFLNSNTDIVALGDRDLHIIQHFLGLGPKIGQSLVRFDDNDRIVVIEGPLKGLEGSIIKVDKRKQRAKICVDFGGTTHTMDLSFEDISKQ